MNAFLTKFPASLLIVFLFLLAIVSCKKDPYELGFDLLPPSDTLHVLTTDTVTVEAFSVWQDSTRTDKTSSLIMGSILDPVFGKSTAGFFTQVRLSSEEVAFGDNPVLDSLVLMLFHSGYYGDTLTRQNVRVYEISDDFLYDSLHFSNQKLATYPALLADQDFVPKLSDSVKVYDAKLAPHLRINLSNQTKYLGNKILGAPADVLATNAAWVKFFKGLYVTASPVNSKGALLNFNIASDQSRLVVYFHDGTDPLKDSLSYEMPLNQSCARFINIDHHGYLDASQDLKQQILNHDSTQGDKKLFLQGMGGVKIKLKFPFFADLAKDKIIAINDAVLQIKNVENDTTLSPPPAITIVRQDSVGRIGYLVDENEGTAYFGGTYDETNHSYAFRLTQHLQNVLQNAYKSHYELYMMVNTPVTSVASPNRVELFGTDPLDPGSGGSNRMQLKITYTILN